MKCFFIYVLILKYLRDLFVFKVILGLPIVVTQDAAYESWSNSLVVLYNISEPNPILSAFGKSIALGIFLIFLNLLNLILVFGINLLNYLWL